MSHAIDDLARSGDVGALALALVNHESPSGAEATLADALEALLESCEHLEVLRHGNTIAARTMRSRPQRLIWAGHIDTVPANNNLPGRVDGGWLWGRGSVDMKGGVATALALACQVAEPVHDVTWIFYDNEEVEATKNGLGLFGTAHPEWVRGDLAIVGEPSNGQIEGGCNGTLRCEVTTSGVRAHSARSWMGDNAIHRAAEVLTRLATYSPATVSVDGLDYREGLNAVGITGGVAGNVIPDSCTVTVNYRFAPDKSPGEAQAYVRDIFHGFDVTVTDQAPGARPGIDHPLTASLVDALGVPVGPKYGWTDVARFGEWGIPAINYGPGDPSLAHTDDESVAIADIEAVFSSLKSWLTPGSESLDFR
jgi:succinyl-diaminopimelate desuccinylase